ncbi:reverse transcriptase-like protein [Exiguobacterium antarcticum]|uniref:reverse transcriptase-like protein n=1 Tax=Exiguobacterium antarcticum TaxID=132920 RepID=UPI000285E6A2|nr:reverse transcriptase-like protein [Exiguobacterium antarcticum]AFS70708.1 14.7 kDa ribonuclease H-like protein [Exiguobacterium antarcticum B7]
MVELYFDGAVRPSNDDAAVGIFCKNSAGQVIERTFRITAENNHEAEFQAFLKAVELAEELAAQGESVFSFRTDSEAVSLAVEREFAKNKGSKFILIRRFERFSRLPLAFVKWIPRSENKADRVAKEALNDF